MTLKTPCGNFPRQVSTLICGGCEVVLTFGMKHGYLSRKSRSSWLSRSNVQDSPSRFFRLKTVELMLRTAQASVPEVLPFLCVSLFTGARPEETSKLLWSDFNLPDKKLIIRPEISKTNRHRPIDLSDNAVAWLETFKRQEGQTSHGRLDPRNEASGWKDREAVLKLLRHTHNFDSRSWGYVEAKARELVRKPTNWRKIKRVAKALLERQTLSGDELLALLK